MLGRNFDSHIPLFVREGIPIFSEVEPKEVTRYLILTVRDPFLFEGEPGKIISEKFQERKKIGKTEMLTTYRGTYNGTSITICSCGSGAPEIELALMEFIKNCPQTDTIVRLGASGGFQRDVLPGDIVISSGAVRDEGSSKEYISPTYPALANYEVLLSQIEAAESLLSEYHVGITRSSDTMYPGLGRPAFNDYIQEEHEKIVKYWNRANVLNIDRETSLLLTLTSLFKLRGGSVTLVVDNYLTGGLEAREELKSRINKAILVVLEGMRILSDWDKTKEKTGKKWYIPSL